MSPLNQKYHTCAFKYCIYRWSESNGLGMVSVFLSKYTRRTGWWVKAHAKINITYCFMSRNKISRCTATAIWNLPRNPVSSERCTWRPPAAGRSAPSETCYPTITQYHTEHWRITYQRSMSVIGWFWPSPWSVRPDRKPLAVSSHSQLQVGRFCFPAPEPAHWRWCHRTEEPTETHGLSL